jgi:hypothetical protein
MSYAYYVPFLEEYCQNFERPRILEIGVDQGGTLIPLVQRLTLAHKSFQYDGIDIRVDDGLIAILCTMRRDQKVHTINYLQCNSLKLLPYLIKGGEIHSDYEGENGTVLVGSSVGKMYDLILIDGDHNYFTVSKELDMVSQMASPSTLIVCDDYHTCWAYKDMFYSERESHKELIDVTPVNRGEKAGVRPAVDEFLEAHPEWKKLDTGHVPDLAQKLCITDACILYHVDNISISTWKKALTNSVDNYLMMHRHLQNNASTIGFMNSKDLLNHLKPDEEKSVSASLRWEMVSV